MKKFDNFWRSRTDNHDRGEVRETVGPNERVFVAGTVEIPSD